MALEDVEGVPHRSLESIDEFEEMLGSDPLRQGDIFEWVEPFRKRPWQEFGVVVTADCDLARNKMGNVISFVPLLSFEDYVWHFWREKRFSQQRTLALQEFSRFINKQLAKQSKPELTVEAAQDWAIRDTPEMISSALDLTDINLKKKLQALCERFCDINAVLVAEQPDQSLLEGACEHLKRSGQTAVACLAQEFQSTLAKLPGDVFYFSQVRGKPGGAFAMLRHIRQCDFEDIAIEPDQIRFEAAKARRVARLQSPFKYALTQQLARVFSDIGLPSTYDERLKTSSLRFFGEV